MPTTTDDLQNDIAEAERTVKTQTGRASRSAQRAVGALEDDDDLDETEPRLTSQLEDMAERAGRAAGDVWESGRDTLSDAEQALRQQLRTRPLLTLAATFVAGFILAKLGRH